MKTIISKGRDGWQAETMTEANANGEAWQINTHKTAGGVGCNAVKGKLDGAMFSFSMFGADRLKLAFEAGQCNENKVKAVHAAGLAEFARHLAETPEILTPAYVVAVGQIIFTEGPGYDEQRRVIYEIPSPGNYKTVTLDGKELHCDNHLRSYGDKFGIGTYYNEGEVLPVEEIPILIEAAQTWQEIQTHQRREAEMVATDERTRKINEGAKILAAIPAGVVTVIVAECRIDKSDLQSDYYAHSTSETVYLAWSTHKRDLFAEMRKAAGKFEPTKCYETAPVKPQDAGDYWTPEDENREKYSMGEGYYLGESKYSGWIVRKAWINSESLANMQIAAAEGRFLCTEDKAPDFEPIKVEAGKIQVIEYSEKALAVIGDTKPIKDQLKDLGGRFNFRLSCGAGWIFPKSKISELQTLLTNVCA